MESLDKYDICIIGAGLAGSAIAAYLGRKNIRVAIIEKNWEEQDRIVGELLQPGGVQKLHELDLSNCIESIDAQKIYGYGMFYGQNNFKIDYPQKSELPANGYGLRNGKFIQQFRKILQQLPNVKCISGTAKSLVKKQDKNRIEGVAYIDENKTQKQINATLTLACDGMFSLFRKELSECDSHITSYFLGLLMQNAELPYQNHGHVIVADPCPFLIYPVSSKESRVLIDFPGNQPPRKGEALTSFLRKDIAEQMPESCKSAFLTAVENGKFKFMPAHRLPAQPKKTPGIIMLGDSLNMRHPITGGGMTVALSDAKLLGDKLLELINNNQFENEEKIDDCAIYFYKNRHKESATLNILADALYGVFRNEDLKQACFNYLERGGKHAEGPISILSAMSRDQNLLTRHFFSVVLFGMMNMAKPFPTYGKVRRSYRMVKDAVEIVQPLLQDEHPKITTRLALSASRLIF